MTIWRNGILADITQSSSFVRFKCWANESPFEKWDGHIVKFECLVLWVQRLVDLDFWNPSRFIKKLWTDDYTKSHCFWQPQIWIVLLVDRDTLSRDMAWVCVSVCAVFCDICCLWGFSSKFYFWTDIRQQRAEAINDPARNVMEVDISPV